MRRRKRLIERMKKVKKISIAILICLGITLTGCGDKGKEASKAAETEMVNVSENEGIDVFGEVKVATAKEIFIDFSCIVEKVYVKDGEKVKKGDKILSLNIEEYQATILKKENEIMLYEGQLNELGQNINPLIGEVDRLKDELSLKQGYASSDSDPEVKTFERSLMLLEEEIKQVKKEYAVNEELFNIGNLSPKELEDSKQKLNQKQEARQDLLDAIDKAKTNRNLEVSGLRAKLKSSEAQLTNTDKQKAANSLELRSKLKTAKLDLQVMKSKLNKTYIKESVIVADTDNLIVYDITCSEGTVLGGGEKPIMKIMDENTLCITVDIPEEFLGKAAVGSEASIIPYADKESEIKGKVTRIADRAIKQNGETIIKADITVQGDKKILKPGLTVDVKIH